MNLFYNTKMKGVECEGNYDILQIAQSPIFRLK